MKHTGGLHLILDGRFEDNVEIDVGHIIDTFDALVESLGMEYLTKPRASYVELDESKIDTDEDEGGVSVFAQITTSHIALHVWPLRRTFCMDIFSCKDFDLNTAGNLLWKGLGFQQAVVWAIRRDASSRTLGSSESVRMVHKWQTLFV